MGNNAVLRRITLGIVLLVLLVTAGCTRQTVKFPSENAPTNEVMYYPDTGYCTYQELVTEAEMIVCADVTEHMRVETLSKAQTRQVKCYAQIKVREVLKGDLKKGDILYVGENGAGSPDIEELGLSGGLSTLCGGPMMEKGNRVVLFLRPSTLTTENGEPMMEMASSYFGKFFYDSDGKYHYSMMYNEHYSEYAQTGFDMNDAGAKTLRELKAIVSLYAE